VYRRTLHSYLRATLRAIGADRQCFAGIPAMKPVRPREVTATLEEFEQVFRVAGPMLQLAMLLAREAGLRHAAIMQFTQCNCNFETKTVSGKTKADSSYTVPMSKRLYERLLFACAGANHAEEPLLAQWNRNRKPPHYNSLTCALSRAKKLAGVPGTKWGFHDLRRTAARALYETTHDIHKVQGFLGHVSPQQSWWYLGNAAAGLTSEDMEGASSESAERLTA
jgi:integrase